MKYFAGMGKTGGEKVGGIADRLRIMHWPRLAQGLLLLALAIQIVRLFWAIVTPVGPLGDWRGRTADIPAASARAALFGGFDPFYPAAPASSAGPQQVTSLALTLFGIRLNEGSGLGSAIVASGDGAQNSYAVGDEIAPGVVLKAVAFDHVVIDHAGTEEMLFLDQSSPVPPAGGRPDEQGGDAPGGASSPSASPPARPVAGSLTVAALKAGVGFGPRMSNGRITGIVLSRKGPGFEAAGFRPGDIITQVNGRDIGSADDLAALQQALAPGARISLTVERGAQAVPIAIVVQGQ